MQNAQDELKELISCFMDVVKLQEDQLQKYIEKDLEDLKNVDTTGWPERQARAKEQYETLLKINQALKNANRIKIKEILK